MGPVLASLHSEAVWLIFSLGSSQDTAKYIEMDIICRELKIVWSTTDPAVLYLILVVYIVYLLNNKSEVIIPRKRFVYQVKI